MATFIRCSSLIDIIYSYMYSMVSFFWLVFIAHSIWRQRNSPSKMISCCIIFLEVHRVRIDALHFAFCKAIFKFFKKYEVHILYFLKIAKHKVSFKRFNFLLRLFTLLIRSIQIVKQVTYLGCVITLLNWFCFISKKKQIDKQFFLLSFFLFLFWRDDHVVCFAHNSNGVNFSFARIGVITLLLLYNKNIFFFCDL